MKAVDPFSRRRQLSVAAAMMMKRRFQVKMGAQQYHPTAGHPRDIQTRSDRELVFLLQKDPTQRTVHVSHLFFFFFFQLCLYKLLSRSGFFFFGLFIFAILLPGARDVRAKSLYYPNETQTQWWRSERGGIVKQKQPLSLDSERERGGGFGSNDAIMLT